MEESGLFWCYFSNGILLQYGKNGAADKYQRYGNIYAFY